MLSVLLSALATTPGNTVTEKLESLITSKRFFTIDPEALRPWAQEIDKVSLGVSTELKKAGLDLEAGELAERFCNCDISVSRKDVREEPRYFSRGFLARMKEHHRRAQEMRGSF